MTGYLQRLLDRNAPAPAAPGAAGGDAPVARPAMPSRSPIAAADQRLNDPNLAALIAAAPPPRTGETGLFGPEPEASDYAPGHPTAKTTGYTERSIRRAGRIRDRRESETPSAPASQFGRAEPPSPSEPPSHTPQPPASQPIDELSEPVTPPPAAPLPAEHPLRRLDVDIIRPPAEAPTPSDRTPSTSPETAAEPERPSAPDLRLVEDPDGGLPDVSAPRPTPPGLIEQADAAAPEPEQQSTGEADPQTVEPPPLPVPPPPPRPEPETIVIEKTEPARQAAPAEQAKQEAAPPAPVERPRPGPKTAAAASLIGPLPQRMRVRTLFGVRRR